MEQVNQSPVIFNALQCLLGTIGILCMMVAKAAGASQVMNTEVNNERLNLAKNLGATHTLYVK